MSIENCSCTRLTGRAQWILITDGSFVSHASVVGGPCRRVMIIRVATVVIQIALGRRTVSIYWAVDARMVVARHKSVLARRRYITRRRWWRTTSIEGVRLTFQHRVVSHWGEYQAFLVVVFTEDFVFTQVESVSHAEPVKIDVFAWTTTLNCYTTIVFLVYLWLHCWHAKHSRWYTLLRALITISKAGITLLQAAQNPVLPKSRK